MIGWLADGGDGWGWWLQAGGALILAVTGVVLVMASFSAMTTLSRAMEYAAEGGTPASPGYAEEDSL